MSNIVLLTTGCANSTVVMRMLAELGWNISDADQYAELPAIRSINYAVLRNRQPFDKLRAAAQLIQLRQPWAIKHPEMCHLFDHWKPLLEPYSPLLLWVTKRIGYVRQSFKRRFNMAPELADQRFKLCEQHFIQWAGPKLKWDVEQISEAVKLFDVNRVFSRG